jgi:hypothetical protein
MADERMTRHEVTNLRRSAACTDGLLKHQALTVLDELEHALAERDELCRILEQMSSGPWPDMRELLTEMHRVLNRRP